MAFVRGNQGALYFFKDNSQDPSEIEMVRSWTLNVEKDVLDATSQGATFRLFVGGLISATGSAEVLYNKPASGADRDFIIGAVTETDNATAKFKLMMEDGDSTDKEMTFNGLITGSDYSATVSEVEVITVNFSVSGEITVTNL